MLYSYLTGDFVGAEIQAYCLAYTSMLLVIGGVAFLTLINKIRNDRQEIWELRQALSRLDVRIDNLEFQDSVEEEHCTCAVQEDCVLHNEDKEKGMTFIEVTEDQYRWLQRKFSVLAGMLHPMEVGRYHENGFTQWEANVDNEIARDFDLAIKTYWAEDNLPF